MFWLNVLPWIPLDWKTLTTLVTSMFMSAKSSFMFCLIIKWMLLLQEMKMKLSIFYMIHLFDNPQQVQIVNFRPLLHIILSLSSPMVMSISSSVSLPPFSWWTPGISVTAAYDCEFNCFVSFHIKFWSNYIIANFTCTLKRYRKESSTYWVSLWANVTSVCL